MQTVSSDASTKRDPESTFKSFVMFREPKVPVLVKLEAVTPEARVAPVRVPAAAVTVMAAVPSKSVPFIARAVAKAVAVAALPVADPAVPEQFPVTFPVMLPENVPVIVPPSMEELPTSMAPNPLVMDPAPSAPTDVIWVWEASTLRVTVPVVPPPDNPVPAVTPVMSPTVGAAQVGTPEARVNTSVSEPLASLAKVVVPLA